MKKNIIISLFLLLLIVMIGSCARSRGYVEGLTGTLTKLTIDKTRVKINNISSSTSLSESNFLIPENLSIMNSPYCAIIDGSRLKIIKQTATTYNPVDLITNKDYITWAGNTLSNGDKVVFDWNSSGSISGITKGTEYFVIDRDVDKFKVSTTSGGSAIITTVTGTITDLTSIKLSDNTIWDVIWESYESDRDWTGNSLRLSSANNTTTLTLGSKRIANVSGTGTKVELIDGDLVIKTANGNVIWSLLSDEIKSTNAMTREYINRGSRIYQTIELDKLKKKLSNYDTYTNNLTLAEDSDRDHHNKLVELRRQMDFEIGQLNGKDGSKLAVSTNTLQSTMYLNLGITVLAASLFVLIVTR